MKNLKNLISLFVLMVPNLIHSCYSNPLPQALIKELEYKQLLLAIQNTPAPSQELLDSWLKIAFKEDYQNIIEHILLHTNINLYAIDEYGNTWLHYAAISENPAFMSFLLRKGINPNIQNIFGDTALHQNLKYNPNPKIVSLLVNSALASLQIVNNDGQTAAESYFYNNYYNYSPKIISMLKKRCMCYYL